MAKAAFCKCGCGTKLTAVRGGAKFASSACRTRYWRQRHQLAGEASRKRHAPRSPDMRLSYQRVLDAMRHFPGAEQRLRNLLSPTQREHLDKKEKKS